MRKLTFIVIAVLVCVALHAAEEVKPKVNNADVQNVKDLPPMRTDWNGPGEKPTTAEGHQTPPVLPPVEIERYWIKEAKYQKALANAMKLEKERDEQTRALESLCGISMLMLDPGTDKIFCK